MIDRGGRDGATPDGGRIDLTRAGTPWRRRVHVRAIGAAATR